MITNMIAAFFEGFKQGLAKAQPIEVFEAKETERQTHKVMCGHCETFSELEFVTMRADGRDYYQIAPLDCCDEIKDARCIGIN